MRSMMKAFGLITALLCCSFVYAQAKEFPLESGNAFLRLCSSVEREQTSLAEKQDGMGCMLYIAGFVQGVEVGNTTTRVQTKQAEPMPFCRPENAENAQLVKIVLKYIRENPQDAHQSTMLVALWAFQKAFPCA
jgi:hypothetical protein